MNKQFLPKILLIILIAVTSFAGGWSWQYFNNPVIADNLSLDEQEATVRAIKKVIPAVVSIIVRQDISLNVSINDGEEQKITKKEERSQGTGFLISADGYILTNKHVVQSGDPKKAEYTIILSNGKQYFAQFIGIDPLRDLAVLKIFDKDLPYIELGNSDELVQGMSVIAIGNAFGRYQNSVTKGIVSALGRNITASDNFGNPSFFDNVIQTDTDINQGNSGGPLVDLYGRVIGINSVVDQSGTSFGFAIPINDAKPVIRSIKEENRIIRPRLGVYYKMITPEIALEKNLPRKEGAWVINEEFPGTEILADSPAAKAGLQSGDIIFEINAIKLSQENSLFNVLQNYKPGDKIGMKVQRGRKILILIVALDEFK